MKSGVFIERDGILTLPTLDKRGQVSPRTIEELKVNRHAVEPLSKLKEAGFVLLVTTNQPGISRGYLSRRELDLIHGVLRKTFPIDEIFVCPHDETDRCPCRKPKPGLLLEAAFGWHLDMDRCFAISDKWQDAQAAHVAGCTSIMIDSPWIGSGHHDFVVNTLPEAVHKVLQLQSIHCPSGEMTTT